MSQSFFAANMRIRIIFAPLLGGALYALANVGFGLWPLAFVAFIPLWIVCDSIAENAYGQQFAVGFLFGFIAFLFGTHWLLALNDGFIGGSGLVGSLLWLGLAGWFALAYGAYALVYGLLKRQGFSHIVAAVTPLVLLEWLQFNLFPAYAGAGLIHCLALAQLSSLGGPLLMSAFVVSINSLLYSSFSPPEQSRPPRAFFLSLGSAMVVLALLYGTSSFQRFDASDDVQKLKVGVVQSNLVRASRDDMGQRAHSVYLKQSRELLSEHSLDLLIWPESAYERGLRRPLPLDGQFIRKDVDVPLLFGGTSVWQSNGQKVSSNSVFLVEGNGKITQSYDKHKLLPIAETRPSLPFASSLGDTLIDFFPEHQDFRAGISKTPFILGEHQFSVPICYEMVLPDYIHTMVAEGRPDFLVTLANDAWFGDTQGPQIHLALAQSRAIEHRVWVVRSTNSGVSAVIDPTGRIVTRTSMNTRDNMSASFPAQRYYSWYTEYGNWPVLLVLLIALIDASRLMWLTKSRRQKALSHPKTG